MLPDENETAREQPSMEGLAVESEAIKHIGAALLPLTHDARQRVLAHIERYFGVFSDSFRR